MKKMIWMAVCAIALFACGDDEPNTPTLKDKSYVGTVTVIDKEYIFEQPDITVVVKKRDGKTVDIEMQKVKFSSKMPVTIDMVIPAVTATVDKDGNFSLSGTDIVPTTGGEPFAQYTFTELTGTITDNTISLSMNCGIEKMYDLSYTGAVKK